MEIKELLPLLIPLILIELGLMIYSLIDLKKRETVKFNNKTVWALIIIILTLVGSIAYLIFGRENNNDGNRDDQSS